MAEPRDTPQLQTTHDEVGGKLGVLESSTTSSKVSDEDPDIAEETEPNTPYGMTLDVDSGDSDSALGQSLLSSTASLRTSIYETVEENGRTYHKYREGNYYLPNDETEQSRLDLQHNLFLMTLDGVLNLAPVEDAQLVLDIGTGTGIWAIEYATRNPSATVIGTDLSPIQPDFIPPNCEFRVDDASEPWSFGQKFDYIHGRALMSCFTDNLAVFKSAYEALAPGGYFEMQDPYFKPHSNDGTTDGTALVKWNEKLVEGARKIGRDWHGVPKYADLFREAGFKDVVERKFVWPGNPWPKGRKQKQMGLWMCQNALEGVEAISLAMMTRVLGMPVDEVQATMEEVKRDLQDRSIHSYYPVYVVYGRK